MTAADEQFERLLEDARQDPYVAGVVLTGSRDKGWATPRSDYDIDEKGVTPEEYRDWVVRESLDGYINSLHRSLKCARSGDLLGSRLEAAERMYPRSSACSASSRGCAGRSAIATSSMPGAPPTIG